MSDRAAEPIELVGAGGVRLRGPATLPAGAPRAVVALAHGKDEHVGRYRHVVAALVENGYAVYGIDHRGHGQSDGERGLIARFDDFVDDFDLLVEEAHGRHPAVPLYVLGHSMGGLIATRYALRYQAKLAGLILSGPALLVGEHEPAWRKRLLLLLGRFFPNLTLPAGEPGLLSRNPEIEQLFAQDPLCNNEKTKLGYVRPLFLAAEETLPRGPELTIPLLVMHGEADNLTSPRGSERFVRDAASADKTLKLWPDDRHEIFNELDGDQVIAFMVDWLNARSR